MILFYVASSESNPLAIYLKSGGSVNVSYTDTGELFLPVKVLHNEAID